MAGWRNKEEVDVAIGIARRRERQRDWESCYRTRKSVEFCEATPIGLADESKESLYGRKTDRDLLRSA